MAHELFGLPERMHDVMTMALIDGALIVMLPLQLVGWTLWREKQRHNEANTSHGVSIRKRRRKKAGR